MRMGDKMNRPDLLDKPQHVRKMLSTRPKVAATQEYVQAVMRWVEQLQPQKGTANGRSSGGDNTQGSETDE